MARKRRKERRQKSSRKTAGVKTAARAPTPLPPPIPLFTKARALVERFKKTTIGVVTFFVIWAVFQVLGAISDAAGAKQALFPETTKLLAPRPRLVVSPVSKVVEGVGIEARFPLWVTNVSDSAVAGQVLKVEVHPALLDVTNDFYLEPMDHAETIGASSPSGDTTVDLDARKTVTQTLGSTTILLFELGTLPPAGREGFTAVAKTRPGQIIEFTSSTVPDSAVRGAFDRLVINPPRGRRWVRRFWRSECTMAMGEHARGNDLPPRGSVMERDWTSTQMSDPGRRPVAMSECPHSRSRIYVPFEDAFHLGHAGCPTCGRTVKIHPLHGEPLVGADHPVTVATHQQPRTKR